MRRPSTAVSERRGDDRRRATSVGLELCTSAAAFAGGIALAVEPDGSLLHARLSALHASPFTDWRIPGLLLATLVGAGLLAACRGELGRWRRAPQLSVAAGAGLVVFESAALRWIGFQPLEAVVAAIGVGVIVLRWPALHRSGRRPAHARRPRLGRPHPSS